MQINGSPDLMTSGQLSRRLSSVDSDLLRALDELGTGRRSDVVAAAGGDPFRLYALERDLAENAARKTVIDLATGRSALAQTALGRVQDAAGSLGVKLSSFTELRDLPRATIEAGKARTALEDVISALNSRFSERSIFAGAATDQPALASADVILGDIATRIAPAATAADVIAAVDDYFFTDPAGFDTTGYLGSTTDVASAEISDGVRIDFALRADRQEIRDVLAGLTLAVVGVDGGFAGDSDFARLELLGESADRMVSAERGIVLARAELGIAEEMIAAAEVETESARVFFEEARSRIIQKDPFETASEIKALETQLESILAVTARLSALNLTNFLR